MEETLGLVNNSLIILLLLFDSLMLQHSFETRSWRFFCFLCCEKLTVVLLVCCNKMLPKLLPSSHRIPQFTYSILCATCLEHLRCCSSDLGGLTNATCCERKIRAIISIRFFQLAESPKPFSLTHRYPSEYV